MRSLQRFGLSLLGCFLFAASAFAQSTQATVSSPRTSLNVQRVAPGYGRLPLSFIPNQGQIDSPVRFLANTAGYEVFLTGDEAVLVLRQQLGATPKAVPIRIGAVPGAPEPAKFNSVAVRMKLIGAASNARTEGFEELPGKFNYINGSDPSNWQMEVPSYRKVAYHGIYPGIDLIYYGNTGTLEHDFLLAPGTDPNKIQWQISGADSLHLTAAGDLEIRTALGLVVLHAPAVYQPSPVGRRYVPAKLVVNGNRISFGLGNYDRTQELVIDPYLSYSTYLNGPSQSGTYPSGIALDANKNAYITGSTFDTAYPTAAGGYATGIDGCNYRGYVSELNPTGTGLIYSTFIRGSCSHQASVVPMSIAVDGSGNVYIGGYTTDSTYPTTGSAYQPTLPASFSSNTNNETGFVTELNSTGSGLVFSTFLSGSSVIGCSSCSLFTIPTSLAIDPTGIFLTGYTNESDFPATTGAYQSAKPTNNSNTVAFVTKMAPDGSSLLYSTFLGGTSSSDQSIGMGITASGGNAYVTGYTYNTSDFPTTPGAYQTTASGYATFVSELSATGANLVASTDFNGTTAGCSPVETLPVAGVAVDGSGNVTISGYTDSNNLPTTGGVLAPAFGTNKSGCTFASFATRFNPSLSGLVYSTYITGNESTTEYEFASSLTLDASGNAYVTGDAESGGSFNTFPFVNALDTFYKPGYQTVFVTALDNTGAGLYNTFFGGIGFNNYSGRAIKVDSTGAAYIAAYGGNDVPTTAGVYQPSSPNSGNNGNQFVFKIDSANSPGPAFVPSAVNFPATIIGQTSSGSTTLRNLGSVALNISSAAASAEFNEIDSCGATVAAGGGSCPMNLTFSPTATGDQTGTLTLTDNALNSPQVVPLKGLGEAAAVSFSTRALTFAAQQVGTNSSTQSVTLDSIGSADLHITSITTSTAFSVTHNCAADMPQGSSCILQVTFSPTTAGNVQGTITVNDDALDNPQVITLAGNAYSTSVSVLPLSLTFVSQLAGTTRASQAVTIQNTGAAVLNVASITATGDFSVASSTCSTTLASRTSCTVNVAFTPSQVGTRTGMLTIGDDGMGAPQMVALSGTGVAPIASISTTSLTFAAQPVSSTSSQQAVTLTNNGNAPLAISSIYTAGDFADTNNCGNPVPASGSCVINVTFAPSGPGARNGALTIVSNALGGPAAVSLTGVGTDYTVSAAPGSATLSAGKSTTATVTVSAVGGTFSGPVSLSCLGLPAQATCNFSPGTVTPGANSQTSTVTIHTTAQQTIGLNSRSASTPIFTLWLPFSSLGLIGFVVVPCKRKRRFWQRALFCIVVLALVGIAVACGGHAASTGPAPTTIPGTPTGTYTVTVLGSSGTIQQASSFVLTIQ